MEAFTTCLHEHDVAEASVCNNLLDDNCALLDAKDPYSCWWSKIHATNEDVRLEGGDVVNYKKCLQEINNKLQPCLQSLIESCEKQNLTSTKVIRLRMETVQYILNLDQVLRYCTIIGIPGEQLNLKLEMLKI